ncbi:MAG: ZIP family metal transporter [Candidatus Doudnabacteria bacterium]|nr:ZIP family metal transporter [Candidatus Doudnabacteria bacterium]
MIFILSFLTFVSTFAGGLIGLRYKDKLHLILGFTAGVLLAVVAFDLLPEIHELATTMGLDIRQAMIALVLGFLVFHIVEKWILIHHAHEDNYGEHKHPTVGIASALALAGHSFLDGVGIGLGFQVSPALGILVAVAVIAHDFSDGLNTVSLMLAHKNSDDRAKKFLFLDALAPLLGAASTLFFTLSAMQLLWYLGFFAGFLLYIGASDILPEAHSKHSSAKTIALTVLGAVFIFFVTRFTI